MRNFIMLGMLAIVATPCLAQSTEEAAAPFVQAEKLSTGALAGVTGRDDIAMAVRANNDATVSRNSVGAGSVTGTINFGQDAFGSLSGLSVLSANTGNNVAINSSLNVNVSIRP